MNGVVSILLALTRGTVAVWAALSTSGSLAVLLYAVVEAWICSMALLNALGPEAEDTRAVGWLLPLLYMVGLVVAPVGGGSAAGEAALLLSLPFRIWAVYWLGTCVSVGPATFDRVVSDGPYRWMRHPMQSSGLLSRLALCGVFPHWWNWLGFGVMLAAAVGVVALEESFLRRFDEWRCYAARVRYRLLPGVW